jgi:molybdopterin converting factor small subunit
MRLTIHLFAATRQRIGQSTISIEVPDGSDVACLREAISSTYPELAPLLASSRIAIDSEYAGDDRVISLDSDIALIPPVSGGQPDRTYPASARHAGLKASSR